MTLRRRLTGAAMAAALFFGTIGVEAQDEGVFRATPLEATDTLALPKAAGGQVSVIVKLDAAPIARYRGGLPGLRATSPRALGRRRLDLGSPEVRAYEAFLAEKEGRFEAAMRSRIPRARLVHRYRRIIGGVSVVLPSDRVRDLRSMPGVEAVYPDVLLPLATDRSPAFIGAPALWDELGGQDVAGEGVVVGIVDSGIWPEHPSFSDDGSYPAPPSDWTGTACSFGSAKPGDVPFACNHKLLGAARFMATFDFFGGGAGTPLAGEFPTARDNNGHGSHTAATAAGNAGVLAPSGVVLSGVAPRAHLAVYKTCFTVPGGQGSCYSSDSAAAIEQAIADGVDVINFSVGGGENPYSDPVSLAFLDAYDAGVFVAAAAGNDGPGPDTVDHREPWVTTAAAGTTDKGYRGSAAVSAGANHLDLTGLSSTGDLTTAAPVVLSVTAPGYLNDLCLVPAPAGSLAGKVVACKRGTNARISKSVNVAAGGAVGMILYNAQGGAADLAADSHPIPSLHVDAAQGTALAGFLAANPGAVATIAGGSGDLGGQGDVTADFSSRGGPNQALGISKPDVAAPGVNVLAANSPSLAEPSLPQGQLYQIISGTSMASPHVAGAGALLRQLHPDWTPGQIQSALMMTATTAATVKQDGVTPATPFDVGSGRIDLTRASAPGLTISETADNFILLAGNLSTSNYPSLYVPVMAGKVVVERVLKSVDGEPRDWQIAVEAPADLVIDVPPAVTLGAGQSATIAISVDASAVPLGDARHGRLRFTSSGSSGAVELTFPITVVRRQGPVTLAKSCAPLAIQKGELTTCTITFSNTTFENQPVHVSDEVPGQLRVESVTGGSHSGNSVSFNGNLFAATPPQVGVQAGASPAGGYLPLSLFGVAPISGMTDESIANFNVPPFQFAGQSYTRIGIVSNGYVVVGGGTAADVDYINQNLPNPSRPNNVLAPFWTDLNPAAGGAIRTASLTDGVSTWIVVDWAGVPNYSSAAQPNSFEVWIRLGAAQDISYAYGTTTAGDGGLLTVGAENLFGNSGANYYYNGTGSLPTGATQLMVTSAPSAPGETGTLSFTARGVNAGPWRNCAEMVNRTIFGSATSCASGEVTPAPLTITVNDATKVYGSPNPAFSVRYSGFLGGDGPDSLVGTLTFTTAATASSPVGAYAVMASGVSSPNYTIAFVSGKLSVTPAPLVVRANDVSRLQGAPNPPFTATITGFVAGDDISDLLGTLEFSTPATPASPPGSYPITPSGLGSLNYAITFVDGTLTVLGGLEGRMHGNGFVNEGRTHHHFVFRVSEKGTREYARLEYWANEDRRCHGRDHDYDHDKSRGRDDDDYGRDHHESKNRFVATSVNQVTFSDDPGFRPGRGSRPTVDTVLFSGLGRWNGRSGYSFEVLATDRGEPGRRRDTFSLVVKSSTGAVVARVNDSLDGGNIDSTRLKHR